MVFVKSFVVGIATMILAAICSAVAIIIVLAFKSLNLPEGQAIGWDPVSLVRSSMTAWIIVLVGLAVGFLWEYRKAKPY